MKLVEVPIVEAVDGEKYLTKMKHGWIEGYFNSDDMTCEAYYWRDMSWYPEKLYRIVEKE